MDLLIRLNLLILICALSTIKVGAQLVINEINYSVKNADGFEDPDNEWIEFYNPGPQNISLNGWSITSGIDFSFPNIIIEPETYIIVAANPLKFSLVYPDVPNALGPWIGKLSNNGETIRLRGNNNVEVDQVDYADEGFWAVRKPGDEDLGHEGWTWDAKHDGKGNTLELINWADKNNNGQNWGSSLLVAGTPGKQNSIFNPSFQPLVKSVSHFPLVPKSTDPVLINLKIDGVARFDNLEPNLLWRVDGKDDEFNSLVMVLGEDDSYYANIPKQPDKSVIEFYFSIAGNNGQINVWPQALEDRGNACNYLYMVDDDYSSNGVTPSYYVVMKEAERIELEEIGRRSSQADSNAEMNCTFISFDGKGDRVRYLASIRNRGASSRRGPPNNQLIKFRSDDPWNGQESIKFNCQYIHSQVAGSWLYQWLGIKAADSIAVKLRINGEDLAEPSGPRMYGHYARTESFDSRFTAAHWPKDPNGNLYQVRDDESNGDEGDLKYEGEQADSYRNTYFKKTNQTEDDWLDIINLTKTLNLNDDTDFIGKLSKVVDIDQWLHFLAVDSLVGNREGGLTTGKGDDYALYRGIKDQRFKLVPHDLDTVLDQGTRSGNPDLSIFAYREVDGLEEFLSHPDIIRRYYRKYIEILENRFKPELINPIIDRALRGVVSSDVLDEMKKFIVDRRRGVLEQIQTNYSVNVDLPKSNDGFFRTNSGEAKFSGSFHVGKVKSIRVNGTNADINPLSGEWELDLNSFQNGGNLMPGTNRVRVSFYGESDDDLLYEEFLKVWHDTGKVTEVSGELRGEDFGGNLFVTTRSSYIPKVPFLVRVDLRDANGQYLRDVWDDTAILSTNTPGVKVSPDTVQLRNGLGSVLVSVEGGGEAEEIDLISEGSVWSYIDNGSDQGVLWRGVNFDDSDWEKGRAELGYGDDDEVTELSFGPNSRNKYATTYFRSEFDIDGVEDISAVEMRLKYDDGAIIYINGQEFFKTSNMEYGMSYDDYTLDGDDTPSENFQEFDQLTPNLLVEGRNVIAVEIKQGDERSSDISFDLGLRALKFGQSTDPGDISLNVRVGQQQINKTITSLGAFPNLTEVSGVLEDEVNNWSGVIRIIDDLTVPRGVELNISPGTIILVDGDAEPQSSGGSDLIVSGSINCIGTSENPITITSSSEGNIWGQILFDESESALIKYTNIHRAGHSPKGGHTDHGRVLRVLGSNVLFEDCTISDNRGKIGQSNAQNGKSCDLVFRRCHWARSVMGFETFDSGMIVENTYITDMLGVYREDGVTDDNDAIYLHESDEGQSLILKNVTVAYMDDDGIDTLGAEVTAEGVICRNCGDKGISVFGGSFELKKGLLINNSIGISAKDDADVILEKVTISGNKSVGLQVENKDGNDEPSRFSVANSILWGNEEAIVTEYTVNDIRVESSIVEGEWQGGNNEDPLFRNPDTGDFRISSESPAIVQDLVDAENNDMGFYNYTPVGGEVVWDLNGSPYYVSNDVKIPDGVILKIKPGVSVYVDEGAKIEVEGVALIRGEKDKRIYFSHYPGSEFVNDDAGNGSLPDAPPKWRGLKLINTLESDNIIKSADFESAQDEEGGIGVLKSQCVIDDVSFQRTHIRMIYTEDASVVIKNTRFPDMFTDEEGPAELGLDNISEHIKGIGEIPEDGRYIIRDNFFGTNKGHNDVIDVDSGWRPNPILQIIGNYFSGSGDELCDLGGDVFLSENIFLNVFKDDETSDRGYANAISTGDVGPDATFSISRNVFADIDHAISLKIQSATIFENNTVYKVHPDFNDRFDNPSVASVVNLFIPTDTDSRATHGKGAYLSDNILVTPRVFSGADDAKELPYPVTPLEMQRNLLGPELSDLEIGRNHEGLNILNLGDDNFIDDPLFVNPDDNDFNLQSTSPAKKSGKFGQDLGAMIPSGIFITGEPDSVTINNHASLKVGGPGYFAYKWRFKDGQWSDVIKIGDGFNADGESVRVSEVALSDLPLGVYIIEVKGQDFAGNWQEVPTQSKQWSIVNSLPYEIILNEILIFNDGVYDSNGASPSYLEIYNPNTNAINLNKFYIANNDDADSSIGLAEFSEIPGLSYLIIDISSLVSLDSINNGSGSMYLFFGDDIKDSITFGAQANNYSIGRNARDLTWSLNYPTPGEINQVAPLGNTSGLKINEWLANTNEINENEFIELVNFTKFPVNLSGVSLSDSTDMSDNFMTLPSLSYIGPNGYSAINPQGFKLSSDFDQLILRDDTDKIIDEIVYGPQFEGVSQGLSKESGTYQKFSIPTPGIKQPVEGTDDGLKYQMISKIYNSLRITEVMYNPIGGANYEFIELQNTGEESIDLNGIKFTKGIDFEFDEVTLLPSETVVLVSNSESFASRYGESEYLIYEYKGRLNNSGEELVLQFPNPFPFNFIKFSYKDNWYYKTDGLGNSLELNQSQAGRVKYNEKGSWSLGDYLGSPNGITIHKNYESWTDEKIFGNAYEDFDSDGLSNGLEFLIGGSLNVFDEITPPIYEQEAKRFIWEISISLVVVDYKMIIESSDNLKNWDEIQPDEVVVDPLQKKNRFFLPDDVDSIFLRLRLEKETP